MRILQVINSLSGGGAEVFAVELAIALSRIQGNNVAFLTYAGVLDSRGDLLNKKLNENGIQVFHLNIKSNIFKLFIPFCIYKIFKKFSPRVIHSHLDQSDFFVSIFKFVFKVKEVTFVRTIHNNGLIKRIPIFFHSWIFRQFDFNVSCSESVKSNFQISNYRKKLFSINNGVDLTSFNIESSNIDYPKIINKKISVISIGSFTPRHGVLQKGQDILIEILVNIKDKVNLELVFLGDGSELDSCKKLVKKYNLEDFVFFKGLVTDIRPYIIQCDFFCMPSRFEGLPISAIEVVLLGKPMLVSDISAFDVFLSNSTIRFDVNSLIDFEEKLLHTVKNINTLSFSAKNNILFYNNLFDINVVARKYGCIYSAN
jgi:glycosyltransferase involved in cell wall biosynthesis